MLCCAALDRTIFCKKIVVSKTSATIFTRSMQLVFYSLMCKIVLLSAIIGIIDVLWEIIVINYGPVFFVVVLFAK